MKDDGIECKDIPQEAVTGYLKRIAQCSMLSFDGIEENKTREDYENIFLYFASKYLKEVLEEKFVPSPKKK